MSIRTRWALILATTVLFAFATTSIVSAASGPRLEAALSGAAIGGIAPGGHGDWRELPGTDQRISVEVQDVNRPAGTVLVVDACGTANIGTITLDAFGFGDLNLDTRDGQSVPNCASGDTVTVREGSTPRLTGTFQPK